MAIQSEYPSQSILDEIGYKIGGNVYRLRLFLAIFYLLLLIPLALSGAVFSTLLLVIFVGWAIGGLKTIRFLIHHPRHQLHKFYQILRGCKRVEYSQIKGEEIVMEPTFDGWRESRWLVYESNSSVEEAFEVEFVKENK